MSWADERAELHRKLGALALAAIKRKATYDQPTAAHAIAAAVNEGVALGIQQADDVVEKHRPAVLLDLLPTVAIGGGAWCAVALAADGRWFYFGVGTALMVTFCGLVHYWTRGPGREPPAAPPAPERERPS